MGDYVTIPGVELVGAGIDWPLSSPGPTTITLENIADAVAAGEDPHILPPRVKLGHIDGRFNAGPDHDPFDQDGAPALGKAVSLRLANDGAMAVGDLIEIPQWLADAAPSAYPSRSCEWVYDVTTPGGKRYSMVLTAVCFLGIFMPAIQDLEDLERFLAEGPAELATATRARARAQGAAMTTPATASIDVGTIRHRFNFDWAMSDPVEGLDTYWWWARSIRVDPSEVIADDDEGNLWLIPFTTDGEDEVTFGEPQRVRETYVPIAGAGAAAQAAEDRYGQRVMASALARPDKPDPAAASARPTTQEDRMDPAEIRRNLGLAEDATDEQVAEAFAAARGETTAEEEAAEAETEDEPVVAAASAADGTVTLDQAAYDQLIANAAAGRQARDVQIAVDRDRLVEEAIASGRIPPARREHWRSALDADHEGSSAALASMQPGLIPVDRERGGAPDPDANDEAEMSALRASFGITRKGA